VLDLPYHFVPCNVRAAIEHSVAGASFSAAPALKEWRTAGPEGDRSVAT